MLSPDARAALTLKVVGGLTTDEIARAFLSSEAAIAQRIVRAKLGRMLAGLMPEDAEVLGLLALMEIQASRHKARSGPDGAFIPLTEQDRARRDHC